MCSMCVCLCMCVLMLGVVFCVFFVLVVTNLVVVVHRMKYAHMDSFYE